MTATTDAGHKLELVHDRDGRYRWYAADGDTEVSGATEAEACERAQESWPGVEFDGGAE